MGAVYLAEDLSRTQRVALKVLDPELAHDERFRQRFLRESQVASSLNHPNIVPSLASGDEGGVLYLAMEYVDGVDLRELLRRNGVLDLERTLALLAQVAAALDAAHAEGLVHRDVKPGNILVATRADGERAYVCDFGLARHVSSVSSLTGERGFVGTIDYVPPEQIQGGTIDARADVYSLGCVLFQCLAGERPFDRESELSVVFAHLNEPPPRLTDLRPELPDAFDNVFATALAKNPDERYSTCGELMAAATAASRGKSFIRRKLRRRRLLLAALAVLAAGTIAGVAVLFSRASHANNHAPLVAGRSVTLRPEAINLIDARTQRVVDRVKSGATGFASGVGSIVFSKAAAWVTTANQTLVRIFASVRERSPGSLTSRGCRGMWRLGTTPCGWFRTLGRR